MTIKVAILKEGKKENCFSHATNDKMSDKIDCVVRQKGWDRKRASAYIAGGLQKTEELSEVDDLYIGGSGGQTLTKNKKREKAVEEMGFLNIKRIGEGNFGTVFRATEGEPPHRDIAIKVLNKAHLKTKKEVKNYLKVNDARQQNKYIARHFPEVYDVIETGEHTLIVMELLDPTSAGMSVVGDFLQGPEGVPHVGRPNRSMKDIDAMYKQRYGKDAGLIKTDMSGRVKNMLLNPKILEEIIFQFVHEFPMNSDVLQKITKNVLGSSKGVLNAQPEEAQKSAYELEDTLLQFDAIKPNTLAVIMEDLESDMALIWLIMIMIKETYANIQDKEYFSERVGHGIRNLILKIRSTSAVNVVYDNSYSDDQVRDAEPGAASLMMAINALINEFGIIPHDVHDKNALVRAGTGDIVIVDLGNFKEGGPLPSPVNENRRIIKVTIDKRR